MILSKPETTIAAASVLVAVASAFVALCALRVAIVQSRQIMKHNRLSVRPHLSFYIAYSTTSYGTKTLPLGVHLANNGVGPAVLKELRIFFDDQACSESSAVSWQKVWGKAGYNKSFISYNFLEAGGYIPTGEIFPLLTIDSDYESDTERREFREAIRRVDLVVRYESVYGEDEKMARLRETIETHRLG